MDKNFRRIAIVNRGEPARRLITAVRELNRERDLGLATIALYTDPDRRAMFVRDADEAFHLGTATYVDERDGERKSSYLDYQRLERALTQTRAEAVWVGWGFVAEHAAFVDLCDRLGVVFIGPSGDVMRRLGDKITSKQLAEEARVPVAPWSGGAVETLAEAREHGRRLGYPLMIKATAGGGGRGIRRVHSDDELEAAFEGARSEALRGFGDATVFMERLVSGARHVEVQIIGDSAGTVWALGVRDCTIQRRNQKVVEESPSPALTVEQDRELCHAAARLGRQVGYQNAGTVEFLYNPRDSSFSFMEVNARLQVEHPVTEMTTGLDLVKLQLHVAAGGRLDDEPPAPQGHAIEVRLNAEDPDNHFAPAPGAIERFRLPTGPGIRIDTGVDAGDTVAAEFDSMIAKLIASGRDRSEAIGRLRRALAETAVVIRGGTSNKGFLLELLGRKEVENSDVDVGWLDQRVAAGEHLTRQHADIALLTAAIEAYEAESALERMRFFRSAAHGRPEVSDQGERVVELGYQAERYEFRVCRLDRQWYRLDVDGRVLDVLVDPLGPSERRLTCGKKHYRVLSITEGTSSIIDVDGITHRVSLDSGGVVRASAPAVVVSVSVREGDQVSIGDRLAILEAMKTEMPIVAQAPGVVREVLVSSNVQVAPGAPLLIIDARDDGSAAGSSGRIRFDQLVDGAPESLLYFPCGHQLEELRRLILGFDADAESLHRTVTEQGILCQDVAPDNESLWRVEHEILTTFVDIMSLFRRQPAEIDRYEDSSLSTTEYLITYLRDLGSRGESLPALFVTKLRHALTHYEVRSLDPSPELEESLFRIYKAYYRLDDQITPILSVLQRKIDHLDQLRPLADDEFRELLDQLVAVSQGRFPALNDVVRQVRYHYVEQPILEKTRQALYAGASEHLDSLSRSTGAAGAEARSECINMLVTSPQPMKSFLSQRLEAASALEQKVMLEVLVRRYYRLRQLKNFRMVDHQGSFFACAEYDHDGVPFQVVAAHLMDADLVRVAGQAAELVDQASQAAGDRRVVLDFFVYHPGQLDDVAAAENHALAVVNGASLPARVQRAAVSITFGRHNLGMGGVQHVVLRRGADGFAVDTRHPGLHPMMAGRLRLWRLDNFELTRLPSIEDVYLFRAVGRENPKDERLFALAEVRDLTPVTDSSGRIVGLPHLERMLMEALNGIRRVQAQRTARTRLHWNRVVLFLWPPLELAPAELTAMVHKMAPATENLGIERVVIHARVPDPRTGALREQMIDVSNPEDRGLSLRFRDPATQPMKLLDPYTQKVVRLRQRGLLYPYELLRMLTPDKEGMQADFPPGEFVEHDLGERDGNDELLPVDRRPGQNQANVVVGVIRNYTSNYPEGVARVVVLGDPSRGMGALAEPECRRINAAIALAERMSVPLEWYALSAGAKIAMDSGTENMDWIALVLRRLVEFTQRGGEVNIVVTGINVGAQPYWNAEATMLMHTRGVLIMTESSAMVLTGKRALDYSGGVSADDNTGIGGYERIMGPNGQAQYYAADLAEACQILLRHYDHTYVVPGERFPRRAQTTDPVDRDIRNYPHERGMGFAQIGDIFSEEKNPGRKKPFDIRCVMSAVVDQDHASLERWFGMRDAEIAVVWDSHMGGYPVCLLGIESHPLPRYGYIPADGPLSWTAGTLFPLASKKIARAINAASSNRPVVVLANLSGFDGSPESMRMIQLEYGAEIGRAVVNFRGPIVFCVISRYHGGAFVVFSNRLNEGLEVAALEGTRASVIGGSPAAAVVFAREVKKRALRDSRVEDLEDEIAAASGAENVRLRSRHDELFRAVHSEKLGEVAAEFDSIHSVHRAQQVGSVQRIVAPGKLRPYLIDAVERGIQRELDALQRSR
ncbi:MAG: ATP-grasp domain-containing protein [Proteobacteria bacterium]|nr:ATP-grasp domain-containing protein [Pseudomonadota bacterium]